ncbi:hypothetical protein CIL05_07095 [Virgibacillus profundi]|uniref:Uncharacterized protein n=1 Tax=Virgibacillus profundi TaxID=2024555 RepID=A0A2A2IFY2_9BACI|nr:hypothetical protein [Virgibacillus profundi]PAV30226.1 hypothetical protein CIL05_07095 [Virgibacillus profundi]PXY54398.1 hypothetical protein CIT14_07180 [Virgibacillus profundi]
MNKIEQNKQNKEIVNGYKETIKEIKNNLYNVTSIKHRHYLINTIKETDNYIKRMEYFAVQ